MKLFLRICVLIFLFTGFTFTSIASTKPIASDPGIPGLNEFAFNLYHQLNKPDENMIVSPYSLSSLFSILVNGAAGNTRAQMLALLHANEIKQLNKGAEIINSSLKENNRCTGGFCCHFQHLCKWLRLGSGSQTLIYANSLWADENFIYKEPFLEVVRRNKTANFFTVDFRDAPEKARLAINDWVEENTNDYIKDLLPPGTVTSYTRLILANAIYFKGKWKFPFEQKDTQTLPFMLNGGTKIEVPMMNINKHFLYAEDDLQQMLQLPYANSTLVMAILLPKANHTLKEVQDSLSAAAFFQLMMASTERDISVTLPRFKFSSTFNSLSKSIQAMGLTDAFSEKANFSNLTSGKLYISEIVQKALIEANEEGTVAAAATGIMMAGTAYVQSITFNADHPFLFIIFDNESKILLFMGQVVDPR